jgi:hypothetical protein
MFEDLDYCIVLLCTALITALYRFLLHGRSLAGGPGGFHTRVFTVTERDFSDRSSSVTLTYSSKDGEEVRLGLCNLLSHPSR